jgi:hypothetical protein
VRPMNEQRLGDQRQPDRQDQLKRCPKSVEPRIRTHETVEQSDRPTAKTNRPHRETGRLYTLIAAEHPGPRHGAVGIAAR